MKKYFVIGNPIDHSLSPKLHNYWFREYNIDAIYDKKKIDEKDLKFIISDLRERKMLPPIQNYNSLFDTLSPVNRLSQ